MKRTKASQPSPIVEAGHIGVHVINPMPIADQRYRSANWVDGNTPINIRRILFGIPESGEGEFVIYTPFILRLIVNTVEADHSLKEHMQFRMSLGVHGDLKERFKDVWKNFISHSNGLETRVRTSDDILESFDLPSRLVQVV